MIGLGQKLYPSQGGGKATVEGPEGAIVVTNGDGSLRTMGDSPVQVPESGNIIVNLPGLRIGTGNVRLQRLGFGEPHYELGLALDGTIKLGYYNGNGERPKREGRGHEEVQ